MQAHDTFTSWLATFTSSLDHSISQEQWEHLIDGGLATRHGDSLPQLDPHRCLMDAVRLSMPSPDMELAATPGATATPGGTATPGDTVTPAVESAAGAPSDVASTGSSPCSVVPEVIQQKKKGEPALASAGTQLNDLPGLVVCVTGWAQVDGHVECKIATELWRRLGDADKLLAPRVRQARVADGQIQLVATAQRRRPALLRLHEQIGKPLGLRLSLPRTAAGEDEMPSMRQAAAAEWTAKAAVYLNAALRAAQVPRVHAHIPCRAPPPPPP